MRYLSTFSGIGGFELGINIAYDRVCNADRGKNRGGQKDKTRNERERLLSEERKEVSTSKGSARKCGNDLFNERPLCIGYSEIDKYADSIYQRQFNGHKNYGDITKINPRDLPDFDILVGGFPCQAFSIAGKRKGFEDTRGTLFFELARIAKTKRPRYLFFENVKGLLSHDGGSTFFTIISSLNELGYDCQWQVLNSKNHGVPQNRERVFIIGHLRGEPRPQVFPIGVSDEKDTQDIRSPRQENEKSLIDVSYPSRARVYDTVAPTVRNYGSGGNKMPMVHIPEATKKGYATARVGQTINLSVPNSKTRRGRVSDIAQTLDTGMQQHTLTPDCEIRRLTPTECERLQGFPDGWTELGCDGGGMSDTQRYKTLGNAVTVSTIADIMEIFIRSLKDA